MYSVKFWSLKDWEIEPRLKNCSIERVTVSSLCVGLFHFSQFYALQEEKEAEAKARSEL